MPFLKFLIGRKGLYVYDAFDDFASTEEGELAVVSVDWDMNADSAVVSTAGVGSIEASWVEEASDDTGAEVDSADDSLASSNSDSGWNALGRAADEGVDVVERMLRSSFGP